ncbi:MAG: hypothetical protein V1754_03995, partial [Pseudomonadota bacterium]
MWLVRIWVILLTLLVTGAVISTLLITKPKEHALAKAEENRLDLVQLNAELILRLNTREWIDFNATMVRDANLVHELSQLQQPSYSAEVVQKRIHARILSLLHQIKEGSRPELIVVVDVDGKQIARIGPGEDSVKTGIDGLAGYPLVEAALRGYKRDDTWSIDGQLFLMTGAPIISQSLDRYLGALLLGQKIDDHFARMLKGRLGKTDTPDLAFFLRGRMVASSVSSSALEGLPVLYNKMRTEIAQAFRSPPVSIPESGEPLYRVVMAPLPGEAAHHDGFYAIIGPPPTPTGIVTTLEQVKISDLEIDKIPWLWVGGAMLILLVIGLFFLSEEWSQPMLRLCAEIDKMGKGGAVKLDHKRHSGKFRKIALAFNAALDRESRRANASADKDINKILGAPEDTITGPGIMSDDDPKALGFHG